MISGCYRDAHPDAHGQIVSAGAWRANTIVDSVWPLVAGLLKNDPAMHGVMYWAVGAGAESWDARRTPANPATTRLHDEIDRVPITAGDVTYVNASDHPVGTPTGRLEVRAGFSWPSARTLREFGLFGGDAGTAKDSGYLINYVIHPRINLAAGKMLRRQLRLSLRPTAEAQGDAWLESPRHWLGDRPVLIIDGVGEAAARALTAAGIKTIGAMAHMELEQIGGALPLTAAVTFRSKARLAMRAAAQLARMPALYPRTAWYALTTPSATLAAEAGADASQVLRLREQLGALQLALDSRFVRQITIGELAQPA